MRNLSVYLYFHNRWRFGHVFELGSQMTVLWISDTYASLRFHWSVCFIFPGFHPPNKSGSGFNPPISLVVAFIPPIILVVAFIPQ